MAVLKSKMIYHILGFLGGLLLLIFPIFFFESFSLNWASTYSYPFFVIIGLPISIYFISKIISLKFIYILIFLIIAEVGIYSAFIFAAKEIEVPSYFLENIQYLYNTRMVNVIQFNPFLSEYDQKLFYKLKQGDHRFSNLEFSTKFSVNSIGARDDEQSINLPKIICIGDSFTMGWGVEGENMFSSIIEEKSKEKTLNLGVSSYGTAREFLFLNKIDLDSCQHLIIQFCENDVLENRAFVENNFTLDVSNEEVYAQAQRLNHLKKAIIHLSGFLNFLPR